MSNSVPHIVARTSGSGCPVVVPGPLTGLPSPDAYESPTPPITNVCARFGVVTCWSGPMVTTGVEIETVGVGRTTVGVGLVGRPGAGPTMGSPALGLPLSAPVVRSPTVTHPARYSPSSVVPSARWMTGARCGVARNAWSDPSASVIVPVTASPPSVSRATAPPVETSASLAVGASVMNHSEMVPLSHT